MDSWEINKSVNYTKNMGERVFVENSGLRLSGPLWKYKPAALGIGNYWKKKWFYADTDTDQFLQFPSEIMPPSGMLPKNIFSLSMCTVEKVDIRPYSFKIYDSIHRKGMILAAESEESYEDWIVLITTVCQQADSNQDQNAFDDPNLYDRGPTITEKAIQNRFEEEETGSKVEYQEEIKFTDIELVTAFFNQYHLPSQGNNQVQKNFL